MPADKKISPYIVPMLATAVDKPFSDKEWIFELKLDGYRAIAELRKKELLLYSRNGLSLKERYPQVAEALKKLSSGSGGKTEAVLDGEIVLLNEDNKPDFQKLQNYGNNKEFPLVYYVFDILFLQGKNLMGLKLIERKKILKKIIKKSPVIRYSDHIEDNGKDFFKVIIADDLEGMMAKKKDSLYTPGLRTREWLKVKFHKSQEAIIAGFTAPKGSRQYFGSILLAQYRHQKLCYIGNAGTGFTDKTLKDVMQKMRPLITDKSPFEKNIKANSPVTWVKPELVCEVSYSEITRDGLLRHPVYKGLRPEKTSRMVKVETERSLPVKRLIGHK
jgi:bifunctional non-homologous end joining protein LigD